MLTTALKLTIIIISQVSLHIYIKIITKICIHFSNIIRLIISFKNNLLLQFIKLGILRWWLNLWHSLTIIIVLIFSFKNCFSITNSQIKLHHILLSSSCLYSHLVFIYNKYIYPRRQVMGFIKLLYKVNLAYFVWNVQFTTYL